MERANFDGIARAYRWMEYATFGIILERCRLYYMKYARNARRALVFGDGDGRFVARMLKGNPDLNADAVDFSEQMLKLLRERSEREGAGGRVHTHLADARELEGPGGTYDLLVTHFFLDCLTEEECRALLRKVRPHLTADTNWLISGVRHTAKRLEKNSWDATGFCALHGLPMDDQSENTQAAGLCSDCTGIPVCVAGAEDIPVRIAGCGGVAGLRKMQAGRESNPMTIMYITTLSLGEITTRGVGSSTGATRLTGAILSRR